MMKSGKYTTEEAMAALSMTVEEIEEMERDLRKEVPMGKYGSLFRNYLKEHQPDIYDFHVSEMDVYDVCLEVDREAREMMFTLQEQFRKQSPRPKDDFRATVRYETAIRDSAEEIVLREVVFKPR
jgi:hypothetical protein